MNKLLASIVVLFGAAGAAQSQQKAQTIDPSSILYTTPTLSDDIAAVEPVTKQFHEGDLRFHEDEWSQVEFRLKAQLGEVQRLLKEYKPFEEANRAQHGWRKVYVRRINRIPVISGSQPVQQLERQLGVKAGAAPMMLSSGSVLGRVKDGFTLPLGGNVALYGYVAGQNIPVLGAYVDRNPDDSRLTQAFVKLSGQAGLILVDWRSQLVLVSVSSSGQIESWRP